MHAVFGVVDTPLGVCKCAACNYLSVAGKPSGL